MTQTSLEENCGTKYDTMSLQANIAALGQVSKPDLTSGEGLIKLLCTYGMKFIGVCGNFILEFEVKTYGSVTNTKQQLYLTTSSELTFN